MAEAVPLARFDALIPEGAKRALGDRQWQASVLPGGRQVNLCLALRDREGSAAVLRIRRGPALPGADFAREVACHRCAAAEGLAPAILAADAAAGWIVMERVPGDRWTARSLEDEAACASLAERLRRLHAVEVPAFAPADELALLRANCDVLAAHHATEGETLLARGRVVAAQLAQLPKRRLVLCHGDPDVGNFLGPAPMLIDFEYAQVADPTYDLALLLDYYPSLESRREHLQSAMGLDDAASHLRLPLQLELCRIVGTAWAHAQRLLG